MIRTKINPYIGRPKAEIERIMRETNGKLANVNLLMCNPELFGSLNQTFDMCVEALNAKECSDHYVVAPARFGSNQIIIKK